MAACREHESFERESLSKGDVVLVTHYCRDIVGVVKYIGHVPWPRSARRTRLDWPYDKVSTYAGVELVEFVHNGHNGQGLFDAQEGYGVITKLSLVKKVDPADLAGILAEELQLKNRYIRHLCRREVNLAERFHQFVDDVFSNTQQTLEQSETTPALQFEEHITPRTPLSSVHQSPRRRFSFSQSPRKNGSSLASAQDSDDDHKSEATREPQPSSPFPPKSCRKGARSQDVCALSPIPSEKPSTVGACGGS